MSEAFFKAIDEKPFIQSLGQGSTIESLLGGLKMKEFQDHGAIEYNIERSFMSHEYVILEEGLDAPTAVLEQLKDILTSKQFRNGNQQVPIKTKCIVVCTNRSREEIAEDDSIKALMERFPLEHRVEWETYNQEDYALLFDKVLKKPMHTFAQIVAEVSRNNFISPRTAVKAAIVYNTAGLSGLKYVAGFDPHHVNEIESQMEEFEAIRQEREKFNAMHKQLSDLPPVDKNTPIRYIQYSKAAERVIKFLDDQSFRDEFQPQYKKLREIWKTYQKTCLDNALEKTNADTDLNFLGALA